MNATTGYSNRITSPEEQRLYDHLIQQVQVQTPEQMIARFQLLFIEAVGYPEREIARLLDQVVSSRQIEESFQHILNRCCHILINRWQSTPQYQQAIPELIALFETSPSRVINEISRSRSVRRVREIVGKFPQTEQYVMLRRLGRVISDETIETASSRPLGTLIRRYPYLYEHCLLSQASPTEQKHQVRRIQTEAQQRYEIDLSQYVTYRVRRSRLRQQGIDVNDNSRILRPTANPTLLSDRDLVTSLRQFSGKVDGCNSYRDLAQRFTTQSCQNARSFGAFKDDLYEYVTAGVDSEYGKRKFNNLLYQQLQHTLPENDRQPLSDFLTVRLCSHLFNFLVVDSAKNPHHFVFVDLINNLGAVRTTGLLLRILLFCRKVRPYLERRMSILFGHYETTTRDNVGWLVEMLEHLNVALSINFGKVDLSHVL